MSAYARMTAARSTTAKRSRPRMTLASLARRLAELPPTESVVFSTEIHPGEEAGSVDRTLFCLTRFASREGFEDGTRGFPAVALSAWTAEDLLDLCASDASFWDPLVWCACSPSSRTGVNPVSGYCACGHYRRSR